VLRRGRAVWNGTAAELRTQAPASAYALGTSDDDRAKAIADATPGARARWSRQRTLTLSLAEERLDDYVLALAQAGIAVRRLELLVSPLESMFFALTSDDPIAEAEPFELAERALART
jgi:ABC-2 type transport system ATP-binding protein